MREYGYLKKFEGLLASRRRFISLTVALFFVYTLAFIIVDRVVVNEQRYVLLAFGLVVSIMCCYQGYFAHLRPGGFGAKGVSLATTSAVVLSCVVVLAVDYVLTSVLL